MLVSLMVKNLALIESAEVTFGKGLNILSGETGAGKSILMGSVNMALGGKVSKDVIRTGADYAHAEHLPHQRGILFRITDEAGGRVSAGHSRAE